MISNRADYRQLPSDFAERLRYSQRWLKTLTFPLVQSHLRLQ